MWNRKGPSIVQTSFSYFFSPLLSFHLSLSPTHSLSRSPPSCLPFTKGAFGSTGGPEDGPALCPPHQERRPGPVWTGIPGCGAQEQGKQWGPRWWARFRSKVIVNHWSHDHYSGLVCLCVLYFHSLGICIGKKNSDLSSFCLLVLQTEKVDLQQRTRRRRRRKVKR